MNLSDASRRVALWVALTAWLYSWYLIRGLRFAYSGEGIEIEPMPSWLLVVMVLSSSSLLGCAVCAGMRVPAWRGLSIAGGVALFGLPVLGQFAYMNSIFAGQVSLDRALDQMLESQSGLSVALFVAGIPTLLVLAGFSGFLADQFGAEASEP